YVNNEPDALVYFAASFGGHFQILSAEHAALTVGTRFNLGTGSVRPADKVGTTQYQDATQFGVDLPLRVYWFPDPNISIHTEFGAAFLLGSQDGLIFGAEDGDAALAPEGLAIILFRHSAPVGQLGLTFWW
ncbi:MAG: hypothetical protein VX589_08270, partial [Myxococcota bacterium]|nr:hypothetical protein [Myxococcota bacterium]